MTRRTPKPSSRAAATKRASRRTAVTRTRRGTRTASRRRTSRRGRPALPTTLGAALGTLVVTTLLDLSWPARLALVAVVLVLGFTYVVWLQRNRPASPTVAAAPAETAAPSPEDTAAQGDPTNE